MIAKSTLHDQLDYYYLLEESTKRLIICFFGDGSMFSPLILQERKKEMKKERKKEREKPYGS